MSALVTSGPPLSARESAHELEQRKRLLEEAEEKLAGLAPFVEKGFISQEEYRTARSRRDQAAADLELARARHAALVQQTTPDLIRRRLDETEKDKAGLSLLEKRSRVSVAQAEAAVRLSGIRLEEANRQIAEAEKKIAWCTVTARAPGLAVHSELFDRAGERRKIRTGDPVWGGTAVVTLPDLTRMTINGKVPEPEMHHLVSGQPVRVNLDAFPERNLTGVLRAIGSVGASEKNESRSFPVTISLDQTDARFRPGMVARCSIRGGPQRRQWIVRPGHFSVWLHARKTDHARTEHRAVRGSARGTSPRGTSSLDRGGLGGAIRPIPGSAERRERVGTAREIGRRRR